MFPKNSLIFSIEDSNDNYGNWLTYISGDDLSIFQVSSKIIRSNGLGRLAITPSDTNRNHENIDYGKDKGVHPQLGYWHCPSINFGASTFLFCAKLKL